MGEVKGLMGEVKRLIGEEKGLMGEVKGLMGKMKGLMGEVNYKNHNNFEFNCPVAADSDMKKINFNLRNKVSQLEINQKRLIGSQRLFIVANGSLL